MSVYGGIIEYKKERGFSKINTENEFNFQLDNANSENSSCQQNKVVERSKGIYNLKQGRIF